jgi:hypothetical protein
VDPYPVRVTARPDQPSRWLWLVKWLLLIPHLLVLAVLGVAFVAMTIVAYAAVVVVGRYPRAVFNFNVGVLRWAWRVGYYGYWVLGTDRYPPFTLADVPDYPARLEADGPPQPKRWLPLVAWLLALPHILLVVALTTGVDWVADNGVRYSAPGVAGIAVLIAGFGLLFTGRYPDGLYRLLVGAWRWFLRVGAYLALLTDRYPPFRLDLGGDEPDAGPIGPPSSLAAGTPARLGTVGGVIAVVLGVVLFLSGGGLIAGGGILFGVDSSRDAAGYVSSDRFTVTSQAAAVTAEGIEIHPGEAFGRSVTALDAVRITATASGQRALFLGVARESDIDAWLAGTAHDELRNVYGGVTYDRVTGSVRAVPAPADQTFWLATGNGTGTVTLDWVPGDGRFAIVLANVDGTPGVQADVVAAAQVPLLRPAAWGLLGGGALLVMIAIGLILLGVMSLTRGTGPFGDTGVRPPPGPAGAVPPPQLVRTG